MARKFFVLFLAFVLSLSVFCVSAFAANDYTLSGKWTINSPVSNGGLFDDYSFNFTSNGKSFNSVTVIAAGIKISSTSGQSFDVSYASGEVVNSDYLVWDFGSGASVPKDFYDWFITIASKPSFYVSIDGVKVCMVDMGSLSSVSGSLDLTGVNPVVTLSSRRYTFDVPDNYSLVGFSTSPGGSVTYSAGSSHSFTLSTGSPGLSLYPVYKYCLTIDPNGGSIDGSSDAVSVFDFSGNTYSVPVPSRPGFEFGGWSFDGLGSFDPDSSVYTFAAGSGQLTANWVFIPVYQSFLSAIFSVFVNNSGTST